MEFIRKNIQDSNFDSKSADLVRKIPGLDYSLTFRMERIAIFRILAELLSGRSTMLIGCTLEEG